MITGNLDTREFSQALREIMAISKKEPQKVLRGEAKLVVRDAVRYTPPFGGRPIHESFMEQRKAGERTIEQDINSTFRPLNSLQIAEQPKSKGGAELRKAIRLKQWRRVEELLYKLGIVKDMAVRVFAEFPEQLYERLRGGVSRRLRRNKQKPFFVVNAASITKQKQKRKGDVGLGKSGWKTPAAALGLALPGWITKHSGPGLFKDETGNKGEQSITVGNLVGFIQKAGAELRIMQRALDNRVYSLRTRLEHALKAMERKNGR